MFEMKTKHNILNKMDFCLVIVKVHCGEPRELLSLGSDLRDQIEYSTQEQDPNPTVIGAGVTDSACTFQSSINVGLGLLQLRNG